VKYFVEVSGRNYEVVVEEEPGGHFRATLEDRAHRVDYLETAPHEASLLIDGRSATFWFEEENGTCGVSDGRHAFAVRVQDERARLEEAILGRKFGARGVSDVRSVMPGIVTRVLVEEGTSIAAGTPLFIVEAMKMENEVRSPAAGVVQKIHVVAGQTVGTGEVLLDLTPAAT